MEGRGGVENSGEAVVEGEVPSSSARTRESSEVHTQPAAVAWCRLLGSVRRIENRNKAAGPASRWNNMVAWRSSTKVTA